MSEVLRRLIVIIVPAIALPTTLSCDQRRPATKVRIPRAPSQLADLRIYVFNADSHRSRKAKENVTGYTMQLRKLVQRQLVQAGIKVVVRPDVPHDLVAFIDGVWDYRRPGTASMSLSDTRGVVDQFSAVVQIDKRATIDPASAAELIRSMLASTRLAAFAGRAAGKGATTRPLHATRPGMTSGDARSDLPPRATAPPGAARAMSISGSLTSQQVRTTLKRAFGSIKECYQADLRPCPSLHSKVVMRWWIEPDGSVSRTQLIKNTMRSRVTTDCMARVIKQLRFPAHTGKAVEVTYPFIFQPGG